VEEGAGRQGRRGVDRLTIQDAARALGVSEGAVRKRVKRDTLPHDKDENGRVYVYLDAGVDEGVDEGVHSYSSALISQLRDEVAYLREESRRKDEIIMQQAMSVRQLTAGTRSHEEAPESPESPGPSDTPPDRGEEPESPTDEQQGRGPIPDAGGPQEATERRWWEFWR
jgi:hypothetical protein